MTEIDFLRKPVFSKPRADFSTTQIAPSKLAEHFLACRAAVRRAVSQSEAHLKIHPLSGADMLFLSTSCSVGHESLMTVFEQTPSNVLSIKIAENYEKLVRTCIDDQAYKIAWTDVPRAEWAVGYTYDRVDDVAVFLQSQSKVRNVALKLLENVGSSPLKTKIEAPRKDVRALATAAAWLAQMGAVIVEGDNLIRTEQGFRILELTRRAKEFNQPPGRLMRKIWKSKGRVIVPAVIAAAGAVAVGLKRAVSPGSLPSEESQAKLKGSGTDTAKDPNYEAYLRDAKSIHKKHGKCVVAYSEGQLVAVAKTIAELESRIPEEYWSRRILIKDVPEKTVEVRPRVRVAA